MPASKFHTVAMGVPNTKGPHQARSFKAIAPIERNYAVTGVTKDFTGAPLGNCIVRLFNTATDTREQTTVSDASGNYSFIVDKTQNWYAVSYKTGAPDVSGVTVNTLVGT